MLILLESRATDEQMKKAAEDIDEYIKFVVDIKREVATIGGLRHYEGEQVLLGEGSKQGDLWGGGFDLETKEVDYDSMINIRPHQDNPSRTVLSPDIRSKIDIIIMELLKK